jgi:hypothetical protein
MTPQEQQNQPQERFKAYADSPDGLIKNKYLVYQTHDIDHSMAFFFQRGRSTR